MSRRARRLDQPRDLPAGHETEFVRRPARSHRKLIVCTGCGITGKGNEMLEEAVVKAKDLMTRDVAVVRPSTSLLEAVQLMATRRISGLPVVDDTGSIVGMFTEGDLLRWHQGYTDKQMRWLEMLADGYDLAPSFLNSIREQGNKVGAVMSTQPVTSVNEDMLARDVAELMYSKHIKRLPVLRDGKLVGIIARSDLVRAVAEILKSSAS